MTTEMIMKHKEQIYLRTGIRKGAFSFGKTIRSRILTFLF